MDSSLEADSPEVALHKQKKILWWRIVVILLIFFGFVGREIGGVFFLIGAVFYGVAATIFFFRLFRFNYLSRLRKTKRQPAGLLLIGLAVVSCYFGFLFANNFAATKIILFHVAKAKTTTVVLGENVIIIHSPVTQTNSFNFRCVMDSAVVTGNESIGWQESSEIACHRGIMGRSGVEVFGNRIEYVNHYSLKIFAWSRSNQEGFSESSLFLWKPKFIVIDANGSVHQENFPSMFETLHEGLPIHVR